MQWMRRFQSRGGRRDENRRHIRQRFFIRTPIAPAIGSRHKKKAQQQDDSGPQRFLRDSFPHPGISISCVATRISTQQPSFPYHCLHRADDYIGDCSCFPFLSTANHAHERCEPTRAWTISVNANELPYAIRRQSRLSFACQESHRSDVSVPIVRSVWYCT